MTSTIAALAAVGCIRSARDLPVDEGGFIRGTVVARSAQTGLFEPVVGARVDLVGSSVGRTTDENGKFELRRLPLAAHRVEVALRAAGGAPPRALRTSPIRLEAPGQDVDLGELRLGGLSDLAGSVVLMDDPEPSAAVGTLVVLASTPFASVVGRDGRFLFRSVPPGAYDVVAYREGYAPKSVDGVFLQGGIALTAPDIELDRDTAPSEVRVRGRVDVIGADDDGVESLFLSETTTASAPPSAYRASPSAPTGVFTVDVPVGVYRVRFSRADIRPSELRNVVVTVNGAIGLDPVYLGLSEPNDLDADGILDADDPDVDGDGCATDEFPTDPLRCFDADGDGLADSEDPDDDGDGLLDYEETSPGVDGWQTDPFKVSTDDDAFDDREDNCPLLFSAPEQWPDTDGNGIGDACQDGFGGTTPTTNRPTVTRFRPNPAGVGELVEITGTNFVLGAETNVSFGGGLAAAMSVEADRVLVIVPQEARPGTLSVLNGTRIATATTTFSLIPPPIIRYFEPASVRPGELVAVFGLRFEDPAGGVPPDVRLSGNATDASPCGALQIADAMAQGLEVVCFRPPPGSVGGAVRVDTPHGVATSAANLIIQSGPSIAFFTIDPVAEGGTTTIVGTGFSLDGLVGSVTVDLPGAPGIPVTPTDDAAIPLTIPTGASTGQVVLHHPSGDVTSAVPLQIANAVPGVLDFFPPVVQRGEVLTVIGASMEDVETITFTGGATATFIDHTPSQVTFTVPAGAQAGPVTVSTPTQTSPPSLRRLVLMTLTMNTPTIATALVPGIAISPSDEIMVWSTAAATPPRKVFTIDATTLQNTTLNPPDVPVATPAQLISSRGGPRAAVLTNFPTQLVSVDVPSGSLVGTPCTDLQGFNAYDFAFDARRDNLYSIPNLVGGPNAVFRFDLTTGDCAYLLQRPAPDLYGLGLLGNELVVMNFGGELAKIELTNHTWSPDFGTLNPTAGIPHASLFHYVGAPDRMFGFTSNFSNQLTVVPINSGRSWELSGPTVGSSGEPSRNTRWLIRNTELYDLAEPRVARHDIPSSTYGGVVATSDPATFVIRDTQNTPTFYRVALEE